MGSFDFSKEYGIVLEGGGAKGAYQIGVWKALQECGVKIKGISGVSVGALNGALICMGDLEKAIEVWENISYSKVMNVNNELMENLMQGNFKEIDLHELTAGSRALLKERGMDIGPLKEWIDQLVDEDLIRNSPYEFILGTFSLTRFRQLEINAKEVEPGLLKDFLLASSYFPGFKNERLHGEKFVDGGLFNNVPIDMLIKRGYRDIIVVRIFGVGREKRIKIPDDVNLIEIAPRADLGNMFEFDSENSRRNIQIGYYDGLRCFLGLSGRLYYIDSSQEEAYYLNRLAKIPAAVYGALMDYYKLGFNGEPASLRTMVEAVYPLMARDLKLDRSWDYKNLYLSFLEVAAKYLHLPKYSLYTEQRLLEGIQEKYREPERSREDWPPFVTLVVKLVLSFCHVLS